MHNTIEVFPKELARIGAITNVQRKITELFKARLIARQIFREQTYNTFASCGDPIKQKDAIALRALAETFSSQLLEMLALIPETDRRKYMGKHRSNLINSDDFVGTHQVLEVLLGLPHR